MENKRLSNKLNSWFWFILTALPLILYIIVYIFALPQFAKNFDWSNNDWYDFLYHSFYFDEIYENIFTKFDDASISYIHDTFLNLSDYFELNNYYIFVYLFSWMLSVQVYHLIYDVLKFIIEWCHKLIEKAY